VIPDRVIDHLLHAFRPPGRRPGWADPIIERGISGELTWDQVLRELKPAPTPQLPPPAWHGGASVAEVLAFEITPGCPGSGEGLGALSEAALARHASLASALLRSGSGSSWLRRWGELILAERRRRAA
jgi:hypothetical protein